MWERGTADNKIATCAVTTAFRAIRNLGIRLKGDIVFAYMANEHIIVEDIILTTNVYALTMLDLLGA